MKYYVFYLHPTLEVLTKQGRSPLKPAKEITGPFIIEPEGTNQAMKFGDDLFRKDLALGGSTQIIGRWAAE